MNRLMILAVLLAIHANLFGQFDFCPDTTKMEDYKTKTRNVIGLVPSKARVTNGWAIGWSTGLDTYCDCSMENIRINGLHTNVSPFQMFVACVTVMMSPFALFIPETYQKNENFWDYDTVSINNQLNGVAIGLFEVSDDFCMQGVQITALYHSLGKLNGFSANLVYSDYQYLNGVMISGVYNKTKKGKGLQIGLVNMAKEMRGVQIGLWNVNQKRKLPLINWNFKHTKEQETNEQE